MKNILVIGAGRSASSLIRYLLEHSSAESWKVTVGDVSEELARQKTAKHPNAIAIAFDVNNVQQREDQIRQADIVVSMLPASLHLLVAKTCLQFGKHLITASYVSKEIAALDAEAKQKGLLFLNEMGLDPGIDHMSAMQIIDRIKAQGGELTSFKSYCGGLVAPESNDNPWGYKFTWNPRNVVMAGQGTAQYIENGQYKYIP
jgi:saccharopine dehydrogenase-like NADP-dependent oxidoreductase